ncbi:amino acid ABC transporter permease [Paenarthrobacter sp. NPDC090522]|uniref:amino acid ABC transporter permease n=1 Tax=Paenarthrobacter sp. NPDC090522 TaxID=3364383 RepID=UPI003829228A
MNSHETVTVAPRRRSDEPRETVRRFPLGRWISGALILVLLVAFVFSMAQAKISWPAVAGYIVDPEFIAALGRVIVLAVVSLVGAVVLGLIVAVMQDSKNPVASLTGKFYVWFFRGVPLLLQILLWYNIALVFSRITIGIPGTDIVFFDQSANEVFTPFLAALLGLALHEAAYMAEIIRAGLRSVDRGQLEAASALGMPPLMSLRRIILPQSMRTIIPPTGNEFINMLKATSLAATVTYPELLYIAQNTAAINLEVMETLIAATFWYMVAVSAFSVGQYFLEKKFNASVAMTPGQTGMKIFKRAISLPIGRIAGTGRN